MQPQLGHYRLAWHVKPISPYMYLKMLLSNNYDIEVLSRFTKYGALKGSWEKDLNDYIGYIWTLGWDVACGSMNKEDWQLVIDE
jgi:hypothetical protein